MHTATQLPTANPPRHMQPIVRFKTLEDRIEYLNEAYRAVAVIVHHNGVVHRTSGAERMQDAERAMGYVSQFKPGIHGMIVVCEGLVRVAFSSHVGGYVICAFARARLDKPRTFEKSIRRQMRALTRLAVGA